MGVAVVAARLLLASVFGLAGVSKLGDRDGVRQAVVGFGVPTALVGAVAVGLPITEITLAVALLPAVSAGWAAVAAIGLLLVFVIAIGVALARGRQVNCRCFGQVSSSPLSGATMARNLLLAVAAGAVLWGAATGHNPSLLTVAAALTAVQWLLAVVVLVLLAALAVLGWFVLNLTRQQGQLLLRLDEMESLIGQVGHRGGGPAEVAVAPDFALSALTGGTVTLQALRSEKRPVLLVFTDHGCAPCRALMPRIAEWQRTHRDALTIAIITTGDLAANIARAREFGVRRVLLQKDNEITDRYLINGTPSAVLVSADGRIAAGPAPGADAITALVVAAVHGRGAAAKHHHQAGIGYPAPDFTLTDPGGEQVALADYRGKRTVVLFWNPSCSFCARMLDELRAFDATRPPNAPEMIVVSTGTPDQNGKMLLRAPVLHDPHNRVARAFGVDGTPTAVVIDPHGNIASAPAGGAPAVFDLVRNLPVQAAPG
jgi:peroxiredoxin